MSRDDVLGVLRGVVAHVLEVDPAGVTDATRLAEDLGADSIALVQLAEVAEQRLPGLRIDDADLDDARTVGDVADYVMGRL